MTIPRVPNVSSTFITLLCYGKRQELALALRVTVQTFGANLYLAAMAFNGRFLLNLARFAEKQGANLKALLSLTGQSASILSEESCTVENVVYNAVVEEAVRQSGDVFLGLHAGEHLNLSAAGLILHITQSSATIKQALELSCQYANLGCSSMPMALHEAEKQYILTLTPNALWKKQSPTAVRHTAEGMIAFSIRQFQSLTHTKHNPIAVHVPWKNPGETAEYERVYGCPIKFGQDGIKILLKKKHVEASIVSSDYALLQVLIRYAEEKSAQIRNERGFVSLVKEAVVYLLKPAFPTIQQVASHLNLSQRTLQRRLKAEGYIYKELIDELRQEFAERYINRQDLSVSEVAYLLSYADTSAFTRSFKRWYGKTPSEYRESSS